MAKNDLGYDEATLSVARKAIKKIKAEWFFQFICWSLIWVGIAAMVIYAVETGRIQRIDTDTSSPVFDGWWWGIIFYALLFLPCLPIYFRLLLKKFAWHPDFEVTETIITWSDGTKTKTDDALVTGLLSFLVFLMRMLIDFFIAFFISPFNMFIILPYKAKQIRDQFDIKGGRFILGNLLFILIILGSIVGMIAFMVIKWAPEAIQEAQNSISAAQESALLF